MILSPIFAEIKVKTSWTLATTKGHFPPLRDTTPYYKYFIVGFARNKAQNEAEYFGQQALTNLWPSPSCR